VLRPEYFLLPAILPEALPIKANDIEGPIDKSLGTKEALPVRLRKLAVDGEKTLQWSQDLRTSRASRCGAFSV
jgi:hypothetical protein